MKQSVDIPVIYEDSDYIVINKPSGILVQAKSAKKDEEYTIVDYMKGKTTDAAVDRPGIVHRLDRGTSGVMILAKNQQARESAQQQFADRAVQKAYIALVRGKPKNDKFIIDLPIQRNPKTPSMFRVNASGKSAHSLVEVIKSNNKFSLLKIKPKTGRTHQIRVHLQYIGNSIVGDIFYDELTQERSRLMLHAQELKVKLTDGTVQSFSAPLPAIFEETYSA